MSTALSPKRQEKQRRAEAHSKQQPSMKMCLSVSLLVLLLFGGLYMLESSTAAPHELTKSPAVTTNLRHAPSYAHHSCAELLASMREGLSSAPPNPFRGSCTEPWGSLRSLLRPTQRDIGFEWVQRKLRRDFKTRAGAAAAIEEKAIPAVIGPSAVLYTIDGHHRLAALDYAGFMDVPVTVTIADDFRQIADMPQFWRVLSERGYALLASLPDPQQLHILPTMISPDLIPRSFFFNSSTSSFTNNPWRTLVGYSRKTSAAKGLPACPDHAAHCYKCFCDAEADDVSSIIKYIEFYWAYYIQSATFDHKCFGFWRNETTRQLFLQAIKSEFVSNQPFILSEKKWHHLAAMLLPLCRSSRTAEFQLPVRLFPPLPGGGRQADLRLPCVLSGPETLVVDESVCPLPSL